ncbi:uncharacterized protein MAM_07676 [Metarhizium album ARSEF 1941]|uniref:Uncharacterized protein n=1 Tax=Metarhizium album (strain ARSEF 1941) TaxID=1081103 RepID=A0A0B2WKM3_METAS|nr:uncharacterized protein MAM_07676 [Metarhizium album ARSEF 1941]KHN94488.1 hypothetical protein MAM_07676 [Metarhizium album ARSEF 1941]
MEPPDVEILVHVTSPSKVSDDDTYRRLARAYLAFRPETTVDITTAAAPLSSQHSASPIVQEALCPESQDLSFQSAIDNRASPRLRAGAPSSSQTRTRALIASPSPPSWTSPPSQISDSYPLPDAAIINTTPTRLLQRYLQKTPSSQSTPSPKHHHTGAPSPSSDSAAINIPSSIPVPPDNEAQPRPKPDTIPVTPHAPAGLHKRPPPEDEALDITHISNSFASSPAAEPAPPPTKTARTLVTAAPASQVDVPLALALAPGTSEAGPTRSPDLSATEVISHTLSIRPPSPETSTANLDPASLVSPKLDKLSRDLSTRYRPRAARQVDPFERGYWLVDCTSWSDQVRLDTWVFLTNYLSSGLAGWGVWCTRDESRDWMRFYCWGYVAKHIYLLTYLASGREIKATGARWLDAQGQVVLQVDGAGSK